MEKNNISLKEYFDDKFASLTDYMDVRFNSIDTSTKLAAESLEVRLESMNEFRNQMKEQALQFITRSEHLAMMQRYDSCIESLTKQASKYEGMATQKSVIFAYFIASLSIIIGITGLILGFYGH